LKTTDNTSKKTFRELGISLCIITAIRHFADAQLLCKNNRSAASYLIAIRGKEEVGKALLFLDGVDLKKPGGHEKRLERFYKEHPSLGNIEPEKWAQHFKDEANCARFVDFVDMGEYGTWIHPVVNFRNEDEVELLFSGIENFVKNVFSNDAIAEEFDKLDPICRGCYGPPPQIPCGKQRPKPPQLSEDYVYSKL
jgi:AbiV family abortive infection protein